MSKSDYINNWQLSNISVEDFEHLFEQYYIRLVQHAVFYINDLYAAEDIVQEVFSDLWAKKHKFKHINNTESYLFRWVRNDCLNFIKHKSVADKYVKNYMVMEVECEDSDPEQCVLIISRLLKKLPEKRRQVLMMSVFDSKSYLQIAAELDISVNTVKDHIKKAYAFLRREAGLSPPS